MNETRYDLRVLPLFEEDLNEIIDYIVDQLKNPIAAEHLIEDVEAAIYDRLSCPLAFAPYPSTAKRSIPYYAIQVRNFSIFYVVTGNVMEVRRILYSRRDFSRLL